MPADVSPSGFAPASTIVTDDADFDARWSARQKRSAAREQRNSRRLRIIVPVVLLLLIAISAFVL